MNKMQVIFPHNYTGLKDLASSTNIHPSSAGPVNTRNPTLLIAVPTDALTPDGVGYQQAPCWMESYVRVVPGFLAITDPVRI